MSQTPYLLGGHWIMSYPPKPHTTTVNIQAYRYAPTQKAEIEKQISSMLATSFIQPSQILLHPMFC